LVNSASVGSLSESSDHLGTFPVSDPLASSPLSQSSGEGGASLSLSHPDSDNSAGDFGSFDNASGEALVSFSVCGAGSVASLPSGNNLSSFKVISHLSSASSESFFAMLVNDTCRSILLGVSFNDFWLGTSAEASDPLLATLSVDSAGSTSLVFETSHDNLAHRTADLSSCFWRSINYTSVISRSESSNHFGSFHNSSPSASSLSNGTSFDDFALLEASVECPEDTSSFDGLHTFVLSASGPSLTAKFFSNTVHSSFSESLHNFGIFRNFQ